MVIDYQYFLPGTFFGNAGIWHMPPVGTKRDLEND